jgi:hypothetical protein
MSAARRLRRARQRSAPPTSDRRALEAALHFADAIGPAAARHGLLIAIRPATATSPAEVFAVDRHTGEMRCWGCGDWIEPQVMVGSTVMNGELLADDPAAPVVVVRSCDTCGAPDGKAGRA